MYVEDEMDIRFLSKCLSMVLLLTASLFAQVGTQASLTGTVSDPSGAVVPDATVTAVNIATGASSKQQTGRAGEFTILALPVGLYRVTVEAGTFKRWENPNVQLTVGSQVRVEPVLQLGDATQTVSVQSSNTGLQTETATFQT